MTTPNLAITHILQSQAQKEVTANAALDALDDSANRALALAMADADLTLTTAQANRHGLIVLTGTLTAARTLTLPATTAGSPSATPPPAAMTSMPATPAPAPR